MRGAVHLEVLHGELFDRYGGRVHVWRAGEGVDLWVDLWNGLWDDLGHEGRDWVQIEGGIEDWGRLGRAHAVEEVHAAGGGGIGRGIRI